MNYKIYWFLLGAIGCLSCLLMSCTRTQPSIPVANYKTLQIATSDCTLTREFSASIKGEDAVEIRPQVSGTIARICVDEGQEVRKGEVLFVIDQVPYQAALQVSLAREKSAQAALENAQMTLESKTALHAQKIIGDYDLALAQNALTIAQLQLEEAKATLRSAKLALLPSANATGRVSTSSYNGSEPQLAYNVGAEVSWTLDIFGRLNNARKAASAALEEREAYTQAARTQLVATIAEFYYTLEMLDAQMVVAENTLENWKQSVSTQEALFQAGLTQRSNINQAKASLLQAEIQCNELKVQIQKSENSFCSLLGRTATNVARGKWGEFVIPEHFSIGIPVEMLAARPDVRQAEATLKSAFYNTNYWCPVKISEVSFMACKA